MVVSVSYRINRDTNPLMLRTRVHKNIFVPRIIKIVDDNIVPYYTYKRMTAREARALGHAVPNDIRDRDHYDVPIFTDKLITYEKRLCHRKKRGSPSKTRLIDVAVEMEYAARNPFFFINESNKALRDIVFQDIDEWMTTNQENNKFAPKIVVFLGVNENPDGYDVFARNVYFIHGYSVDRMVFGDDFFELELSPELVKLGRVYSFVLFFPATVILTKCP